MDKCKGCQYLECSKNVCMKQFKKDYLYKFSLLTPFQQKHRNLKVDADGKDLEAFKFLKGIENNIVNWVEEGKNLYIYSLISGNGKTSWAIRLIQSFIDKIWLSTPLDCRVLFINVPRFFLELKNSISESNEYIATIKSNVSRVDLVIWDEIGTKGLTEFEHEHLLNLINTRLDNGKSNIYTSNLTPELLEEKVGSRLYSRIINTSEIIQLIGNDKRGLIMEDIK